jgi:hypothetical protein
VGEGVEVAGEEDGGAVHAGGGEEEAVVLGAPAGLPEVFGAVDAEAALVIEDVGVPFAHLPAVQAMGMEGTLTTWRAGERAMRRVSQFSTFSGTRSA